MEKISSRRNPLCVHLKKLGADRGYREERKEFLCDGIKLLEEAVNSGATVKTVLTSSHLPFPLPLETRVYFAEQGLIDYVSPLKNAQNTLFSCEIPYNSFVSLTEGTYVLLDGLQDPGNVGSVIRSADAFGIGGVLLTGNCADQYNPKAVRASMGAIFRQYTCYIGTAELTELAAGGKRFLGAVAGAGLSPVSDIDLSGAIIAVGSEGSGLSEDVLRLCCGTFTIPVSASCESLNAAIAAAIIMWEAARAGACKPAGPETGRGTGVD